jgi:hypothetical protein
VGLDLGTLAPDTTLARMDEHARPAGPYFNRQGETITADEWVVLAADDHILAHTRISKSVEVSTFWIGVCTSSVDPPLIFQTMVFGGRHDRDHEWHTSEQQAREGHDRWVSRAQRAVREDGND